jgi:hypothetical protein
MAGCSTRCQLVKPACANSVTDRKLGACANSVTDRKLAACANSVTDRKLAACANSATDRKLAACATRWWIASWQHALLGGSAR